MRHDCKELVKARPGDGPDRSALGEGREGFERRRVPQGIPAMRVNQDVGIERDHAPRSR